MLKASTISTNYLLQTSWCAFPLPVQPRNIPQIVSSQINNDDPSSDTQPNTFHSITPLPPKVLSKWSAFPNSHSPLWPWPCPSTQNSGVSASILMAHTAALPTAPRAAATFATCRPSAAAPLSPSASSHIWAGELPAPPGVVFLSGPACKVG